VSSSEVTTQPAAYGMGNVSSLGQSMSSMHITV
jgi:hypothetical protein